jgi:hypothetical protein
MDDKNIWDGKHGWMIMDGKMVGKWIKMDGKQRKNSWKLMKMINDLGLDDNYGWNIDETLSSRLRVHMVAWLHHLKWFVLFGLHVCG